MLLLNLFQNPVMVIIYLLAIGLAIGIHEAAHAWSADKLGDDTAKQLGRTTINPIAHLDPVGTILFVLAGFGWGKPVPVDESKLHNRQNIILVALAGPASNLLTAAILALVYRLLPMGDLQSVLSVFIVINLSLMLFNLIPIPPLDGSKILRLFIPAETYYALEQYGFIIVLAIFILGQGILSNILGGGISSLYQLLTGTPLGF